MQQRDGDNTGRPVHQEEQSQVEPSSDVLRRLEDAKRALERIFRSGPDWCADVVGDIALPAIDAAVAWLTSIETGAGPCASGHDTFQMEPGNECGDCLKRWRGEYVRSLERQVSDIGQAASRGTGGSQSENICLRELARVSAKDRVAVSCRALVTMANLIDSEGRIDAADFVSTINREAANAR